MAKSSKLVADLGAWAGNVSSSVFIVFVNKVVMKPFEAGGYGFRYGEHPGLHQALRCALCPCASPATLEQLCAPFTLCGGCLWPGNGPWYPAPPPAPALLRRSHHAHSAALPGLLNQYLGHPEHGDDQVCKDASLGWVLHS